MCREMRDSGIQWIGKIPQGWKLIKYKYFATSGMGETILSERLSDDGVPVYSATQSDKVFGYLKNPNLILKRGDLVIPARGNSIGCVSIIKDEIATCTQTTIYSRIDGISREYLYYCCNGLKDNWFEFDNTAIPQITVNQVQNNIVPVPEEYEQIKIANYLDKKVSQIDDIISKQKSLIEKYKAYKQSLITETVTKGLNKNVPMKDSGIEWIGEIPSHWNIEKGKHILNLLSRQVNEEDEVITCFRDGEVTLRSNRREEGFTFADKEIGYQGIEPGDLVIHGMDGFAGAIGISDSRGKASPVLNVCDTKENKRYIMYYLRRLAYNNVFLALATGIRVRSCDLRWNKIGNLLYPIPPKDEQDIIVDYLDNKIIKIDNLVQIKQDYVDKLEEYKKSLIYECVTGKREVN